MNKPDFVFMSSPSEQQIVVVELKNPQTDLTLENRTQLQDYLTWFEGHYPDADRRRLPDRAEAEGHGISLSGAYDSSVDQGASNGHGLDTWSCSLPC